MHRAARIFGSADTYTKPELPEAAKENTERGAEAAAEHYLALMVYGLFQVECG